MWAPQMERQRNVAGLGADTLGLALPDFVRDGYHLPDRALDFLELIATYTLLTVSCVAGRKKR